MTKAPPSIMLRRLVEGKFIDGDTAEKIQRTAAAAGKLPIFVLQESGITSEAALLEALSRASGKAIWRPSTTEASGSLSTKLNFSFMSARLALPLRRENGRVLAAVADPFDQETVEGLKFAFGEDVEILIGSPTDIRRALASTNTPITIDSRSEIRDQTAIREADRSAPAARGLQQFVERAVDSGASDIHIEPRARAAHIRFRRDGELSPPEVVSLDLAASIIGRAKVLADLDIAESRLPQDGRASFVVRGANIDVRVAIAPTHYGESMVCRLLHRSVGSLDFAGLGFNSTQIASISRFVSMKSGMLIVSGPTGSGKTTTLYAALEQLRNSGRKVISIEDPIEYNFDHVVQIQTNTAIGLSFASVLRAILRHDPDVVMVGEIRDPETAQTAVQAALTGHLVLATLHARDAIRAIPRLLDMDVEPYQLAAALSACVSQRLVRRLCSNCCQPITSEELASLMPTGRTQVTNARFHKSAGCNECFGAGYRGRVSVAEMVLIDDDFSSAIARRMDAPELERFALQRGYAPLHQEALNKAASKIISLEDALSLGTF